MHIAVLFSRNNEHTPQLPHQTRSDAITFLTTVCLMPSALCLMPQASTAPSDTL